MFAVPSATRKRAIILFPFHAQIADCIKFVGEDAFYKVYEEDGKSGKDIKHRPAFMRMFEDCREGLVSKIVVGSERCFSLRAVQYGHQRGQNDA